MEQLPSSSSSSSSIQLHFVCLAFFYALDGVFFLQMLHTVCLKRLLFFPAQASSSYYNVSYRISVLWKEPNECPWFWRRNSMPPVKERFFFSLSVFCSFWLRVLFVVGFLFDKWIYDEKKTVILFAHSFYCHITSSCLRVEDTIHTDFSLQMQKSGLQFCKKDSIYVFCAEAKTNRIHLCIFMVKINIENLWHVLHLLYYYADSIPRNFGWGPSFWWKLSQSCSWLLKTGCIFLLLVTAKVLKRFGFEVGWFQKFYQFQLSWSSIWLQILFPSTSFLRMSFSLQLFWKIRRTCWSSKT